MFFSNVMFTVMPALVIAGFAFVFGMILARAVKGARQYRENNASPVLSVEASVVTKRADTQIYHHNSGQNMSMSHISSSTEYYVTFEVESGDRMEFAVQDNEYGQLVEGDRGKLTFQGTRYLGFARAR